MTAWARLGRSTARKPSAPRSGTRCCACALPSGGAAWSGPPGVDGRQGSACGELPCQVGKRSRINRALLRGTLPAADRHTIPSFSLARTMSTGRYHRNPPSYMGGCSPGPWNLLISPRFNDGVLVAIAVRSSILRGPTTIPCTGRAPAPPRRSVKRPPSFMNTVGSSIHTQAPGRVSILVQVHWLVPRSPCRR